MADNVAITAGSGTTIAADDISGVMYQRVKIGVGADGAATDLSSANPMPIGVIPAGTNAIGKLAANSGVDIGDVDVTSISAGTNLIGDVGLQPRTSGGLSIKKSISVVATSQTVKASAGQIYFIHAINLHTATLYLKFWDFGSTPAIGTDATMITFAVPAQSDGNGAGFNFSVPQGLAFASGIYMAATTGVDDSNSTAPSANKLIVTVGYK